MYVYLYVYVYINYHCENFDAMQLSRHTFDLKMLIQIFPIPGFCFYAPDTLLKRT